MDPLTLSLIFGGLGGLGGIFGGQSRKPTINPQMLANLFGPNALAGDTQTLFQTLANSPAFSQILSGASEQGNLAGQRLRGNLAKSGLGGSGIGALSGAVSRGFGANLQLGARGNLWNTAMNAANQNLMQRMGLYGQSQLAYQGTPTMAQSFGNALTGGASTGLNALMMRPQAGSAPPPTGTAVSTAPMRRINPVSQPGTSGWGP